MADDIPKSVFVPKDSVVSRVRFAEKEGQTPKQLHYFAIRGFGDLPRLLLEYTKTPYDCIMHFTNFNYKAVAPFGQMPLYKGPELGSDDVYLAQSSSICRHIARETGITGATSEEQAHQDMFWETSRDLANKKGCVHAEPVDAGFDSLLKGLINFRNKGKYFSGKNPGYGEMGVFHSLNHMKDIKPDFLDGYKELKQFEADVAAIPTVAAFLKSPRHLPLTENELGKDYTGPTGYTYVTPLNPETLAEVWSN